MLTDSEIKTVSHEADREGPFEWSKIAEPALRAALVLLRDIEPGGPLPNRFRATRKIALADPIAFVSSVVQVGSDHSLEPSDLRRFAVCAPRGLREIARMLSSSTRWPEATMRGVWQSARLVGALLDLDHHDEEALARCEQFLGWTADDAAPTPGPPVRQAEAGPGAAQLGEIRRIMELAPKTLLDRDTLLSAYFEWLIAEKVAEERGAADSAFGFTPSSWWARHRRLLEALPWSDVPPGVDEQLSAREPPAGTFPWAALPVVTLAAAVHVMLRTAEQVAAGRALDEALVFAPALVEHDLVLAATLVPLPEEGGC